MPTKAELIKEILQEELNAFLSVQNRGGKASCQENPQSFLMVRTMSHEVQSEAFLASYLNDLLAAKKEERNLMTEKYALMENLIPRTNFDTNIEAIVDIELAFQTEIHKKFPHVVGNLSPEYFRTYLSCELQTLSSNSLRLYYQNLVKAQEAGENLAHTRYNILMKSLNRPLLA